MKNEMNTFVRRSIQNSIPRTMKYIVFLNTLFLLVYTPAFSQRQYSTYQKDGYVGLEFVESHTKITLPIYEKITPIVNVKGPNRNSYINQGYYRPTLEILDRQYIFNEKYSPNYIQFWKVVKDGKCGIINNEGKSIIPTHYSDIIYLIDTSFVVISEAGKTGLVHKNGTVIIPPVYERIMCLQSSNGQFIVQAFTKSFFSLINESGTILSTFPKILDASIQENHVILTNKYSQLKGACNLYGQEIIPQVYDELDLSFGLFSFKKDGETGLMDLTGKRFFSRTGNNIFHIKANISMINVGQYAYQLVDNSGTTLCADTFSTISLQTDFMIVKVKSTAKWGVLNFDGKMIVPATFQSLSAWNEMLVAKKEDKYGIINTSGNTVLTFKYQNAIISSTDVPYLLVKQKGKYGCIDNQLHEVMPCKYEKLEYIYCENGNTGSQEDVRIISIKGTTKGVIDLHGDIKLPYQETTFIGKKKETYEQNFRPDSPLRSDYFNFQKITNPLDKWVDCIILDKKMHELIRCNSRLLHIYNDYFMLAYIDRKWGMIAADGVIIIPFIYNQLEPLGYSHFIAHKDRYVGVLNRSGDTRIAFQYSRLRYFSDAYIIAHDTNFSPKCGLIDYTGKTQIPFVYKTLHSNNRFKTNLLIARKDSLYGVIDLNENIIIPFEYVEIQQFDKALFLVEKNGKRGLIDTTNKIIVPIIYDYVNYVNENNVMVNNNKLYGILSKDNQIIVPIEYEEIYQKNISWHNLDDIFQIKIAGKIGLMALNGNIILPAEFNSISCDDYVCRVSKDSMYYFAHGSTVDYNEAYEEIYGLANIFLVKKNGKYGVTNYKGDVLIESIYDEVDYFPSRGIVVKKDGKEATFDIYGKMIVPLK